MMQKIPKKAYKEKEKRNNLKKSQATLDLNNIAPKLSTAFVKELYKYKIEEECGLRIEAKYITKSVNFPIDETQQYEDIFKEKAKIILSADKKNAQNLPLKTEKSNDEFIFLDAQLENLKSVIKRLNFSIEQTDFIFSNPKFFGSLDIIAHDNNIKSKDVAKKRIIIELKTSGFLNDSNNECGWADESIEEKDELLIEAIHYKLLAKYEWGISNIPFYFMVFSSKNDWEYKIFQINVDEETLQKHYNNLQNVNKFLNDTMLNGWIPYPKYTICRECPLSISICNYAQDIPMVQKVFI